jgi:hypothetical protein
VCRRAGDDVDQARVVEVAEAFDDVLAESVEVVEGLGEEAVPEAGGLGVVGLAGLGKEGLVFAGGHHLAAEILGELREEDRVGELLEQDGRKVEIAVQADAVTFQIPKGAQKREIGLCSGLVEPLHAMRPGAVIDDVGQMRVQRDGQEPCWPF